jgi:hypothetical protein
MRLGNLARWQVVIGTAFFGAALPCAASQNTVRRDWEKYPAVVRIDAAEDIFAVGDVHGDYGRLVKLLTGAKIIDAIPAAPEKAKWVAGKAVVVFVGDLIDKGPNALGVIALLRWLQNAAVQAGGRVIILMGNHEADFLADPDSEKVKDFATELRRAGLQPKDVAACRGDVGQFLCSMPFAARIGKWFFAHAGNTDGRTMERLISDLQDGVDRDGFGTQELASENSLLDARLGERGPGGRSWFEAGPPHSNGEQVLSGYAAALGVAHIVQGHQPDEVRFQDGVRRKQGEMFQRYGLIFLIDTGMSREIDRSKGTLLHIRTRNGDEASAICAGGKTTRLWDDRRKPKKGRAARCGS